MQFDQVQYYFLCKIDSLLYSQSTHNTCSHHIRVRILTVVRQQAQVYVNHVANHHLRAEPFDFILIQSIRYISTHKQTHEMEEYQLNVYYLAQFLITHGQITLFPLLPAFLATHYLLIGSEGSAPSFNANLELAVDSEWMNGAIRHRLLIPKVLIFSHFVTISRTTTQPQYVDHFSHHPHLQGRAAEQST